MFQMEEVIEGEGSAKHKHLLKQHILESFSQSCYQDTELVGCDGTLLMNRLYLAFIFPDLGNSVVGPSNILPEKLVILAPDLSTIELNQTIRAISNQLKSSNIHTLGPNKVSYHTFVITVSLQIIFT